MARQQGAEDSVHWVCDCAYACLLCRDRWLIEYGAMCVSVCVNESEHRGAVLTLELSEQMGDGKGCRLRGIYQPLEEDESQTSFGKRL